MTESLERIHKNQKKLKSKISKHIVLLIDYLKPQLGKIQENDIEYLLLGEGKIEGLLKLCSTKTKFSGDLKNSSLTCLQILLELLNSVDGGKVREIFKNLDASAYKDLALHQHIFQGESNKKTAFRICGFLRQNRPYLLPEEYILSQTAEENFEEWYKNFQQKQSQFMKSSKQVEQEKIVEQTKKLDLNDLLKRYENKEIQGDFLIYQLYFYDILSPEISSLQGPVLHDNDAQMRQNFQFQKLHPQFQTLTPFLHIESPYFIPTAFLKAFHFDKEQNFFLLNKKKIEIFLRQYKKRNQAIMSNCAFYVLEVIQKDFLEKYQHKQKQFKIYKNIKKVFQKDFLQIFSESYDNLISRKENFGTLEKIVDQSELLQNYMDDITKLRNLLKIKNFDLILEEIQKLTNYLENKLFFVSLENIIQTDIMNFLDEINVFILENLDLNLSQENLQTLINQFKILNKQFRKSDRWVFQNVYLRLVINMKQFLNDSIKQSKENRNHSKVRIKYLGFLKFFESEIESQKQSSIDQNYNYYSIAYQKLNIFYQICKENNIANLIDSTTFDQAKEIFNILNECIKFDVQNLLQQNNQKEKFSDFLFQVKEFINEGKELFKNFNSQKQQEDIIQSIDKIINQSASIYAEESISKLTQNIILNEIQTEIFILKNIKQFLVDIYIQIEMSTDKNFLNFLKIFFKKLSQQVVYIYLSFDIISKQNLIKEYLFFFYNLKEQFLQEIPVIINGELKNMNLSLQKDVNINELKSVIEIEQKKLEYDIFQLIFNNLRSCLNLSFMGLYCEDILNDNDEKFYKQKIQMEDLDKKINQIEEETTKTIEEDDWSLINPRTLSFQFLQEIQKQMNNFDFMDHEFLKRFVDKTIYFITIETKQHMKIFSGLNKEKLSLLLFLELEFYLSKLQKKLSKNNK